jgi:glutathione S-transferase
MQVPSSNNTRIKNMEGVHLFHFGLSSCSQRVRFALEEKEVNWIGHIINLNAMENVAAEYQQIHPKGYVPALVNNGRLITESTDILSYINDTFPDPALMPDDPQGRERVNVWMEIVNRNQMCLKTLTYELLFKAHGHFSKKEDVEHYLRHQQNQELVHFMKDFTAGFSEKRIAQALTDANGFLDDVDKALSTSSYLAGDNFSLADIAAIVNVHRYKLLNIDIEPYSYIGQWYKRVADRKSFQRAISAYETPNRAAK